VHTGGLRAAVMTAPTFAASRRRRRAARRAAMRQRWMAVWKVVDVWFIAMLYPWHGLGWRGMAWHGMAWRGSSPRVIRFLLRL